ncbi:MAG: hypothetical protein WA790_05780 [Sulfitobacter sp.]
MRIIACVLALCAPFPALALSCVAPSVERTYEYAQKSSATYVVVHGKVTFNDRKLPREGSTSQNPPKMTKISATLSGRSLSKSGFSTPFQQAITLEVACFGPWCGSGENGMDVLAFLKKGKGGYTLAIDPCGGEVFVNPQPAKLKKVESCFKRGQC